jgi:hypothetical protein
MAQVVRLKTQKMRGSEEVAAALAGYAGAQDYSAYE